MFGCSSPFGASSASPFGAPAAANPFCANSNSNPSGSNAQGNNPFGAKPFGSTTLAFGAQTSSSLFGSGTSIGVFGAPATPAFGAASTTPAFGTFGQQKSSSPFGGFGSTQPQQNPFGSPTIGQSQPSFGGSQAFGSTAPTFGSPSTPTPAFGQRSTPAFGTWTFGLSGSAFGGASAPAFCAASARAFGQANSTPAFGSSPSPFGQSSRGAFSGQTSSAFGGGFLFGNRQAASSGGGLFSALTPGSQPFGSSPAPSFGSTLFGNTSTPGSLFGQTKPAGLIQSSVSVFGGGDDAMSTPKVDVMSIPSSSFDEYPTFLPSYSYKPLDIGRKEIRLLQLQAPIKLEPLCGSIIHVPLSVELHYWALSYCWGSLAKKRTIIVDGKKLQITINLHDALRQLGNSYGMLWVDAICINQEDIPERSREVLRMGDIYSLASGVVAWLGVATQAAIELWIFFSLATKAPRPQYDEYLKELPLRNDLGKFGDEWIALKDLAMNGYWSRMWIIQELVLCRGSKIIHCGTKSLPWDTFENVFGDSRKIFVNINFNIAITAFDSSFLRFMLGFKVYRCFAPLKE